MLTIMAVILELLKQMFEYKKKQKKNNLFVTCEGLGDGMGYIFCFFWFFPRVGLSYHLDQVITGITLQAANRKPAPLAKPIAKATSVEC